jgi:hypothetical protein
MELGLDLAMAVDQQEITPRAAGDDNAIIKKPDGAGTGDKLGEDADFLWFRANVPP